MAEHFKRRGILLLISDFYDEPDAILEAIKPLRFLGNDLIVFHVLDPQEIDFDYDDASSFEDLESGEQVPVVPESFREQYRALIQEHIDALTHQVLRAAHRLRAAQHVGAARPRAVQLSVEPGETHESAVDRSVRHCKFRILNSKFQLDVFPHSPLLPRPGRHRRPDPRAPDSARAEARHRVPVADVRPADSVPVGPPPPDPALVPAADARRGDRAASSPRSRGRSSRSGAAAIAAAGGNRELVILLDQSASMGYGDHWQRAREAARDGRRRRSAPATRRRSCCSARNAEENMRATSDRGRLEAAIGAAKVTSGATRYGPALKLAESILARSTLQRREAILISDFQKSRLDAAPRTCTSARASRSRRCRSPSATTANLSVPVGDLRARDVLRPGAHHRHRRRDRTSGADAGAERAGHARDRRARRSRPIDASVGAERVGVGHVRAVHARRTDRARHRQGRHRPAAGRQRVPFRPRRRASRSRC